MGFKFWQVNSGYSGAMRGGRRARTAAGQVGWVGPDWMAAHRAGRQT